MDLMTAPDTGVKIRMYNPGFGDCFLLAFPGQERPVYVLIDCGVHGQYQGGSERIRKVVADVRAATGGKLDLVVVTHEHADHVSGFYLGREIFRGEGEADRGIAVERAWFAWTEEPGNEKAKRLDRARSLLLQGLLGAHRSLAAGEAMKLRSMLGFYASPTKDAADRSLPLDARRLGVSTRKSRDLIRDHAREALYLQPKKPPLPIPGVDGVRVFVLGPPEDERALLSPDPTGTPGEVYGDERERHAHMAADEWLVAAMAATGKVPAGAGVPPSLDLPFAGDHGVSLATARARKDLHRFFQEHYGFGAGHKEAWRRIDDDWLYAGETLALKLDSATNNTSLVLAIELPESRRVLLFPGDAQVGSWNSWHDGGWSHKNGLAPGEEITAEDLLNRTVLYKVGHHGSHNATLRDRGLMMMTSDELVALIPVDEEWARAREPHPWKMPFAPMYEDLLRRTRGRIVRADHGVVPGAAAAWSRFPGREPTTKMGGDGKPFYVELEIPDGTL